MSVIGFANFYKPNGATASISIHSDGDVTNPTIDGDAAIPTTDGDAAIRFDFEFPGVVST